MCGIAGWVGNNDKSVLRSMLTVTKHRGPDDWGEFYDDSVSLGMNRLSIQDLSPSGHQPMFSASGKQVIVYNGEIYNFKELRKELELKGHSFNSRSDTEVLLVLFAVEGKNMLSKLRGMFAFVIYDLIEKTVFAARDRLGIKPFYYTENRANWLFASELKGLVRSGQVPVRLNKNALYDYLQYGHVLIPDSLLHGVKQLKPGNYLEGKIGEPPTEKQYWSLDDTHYPLPSDHQEISYQVYQCIDESVRLRMISDRKVGLFLSGGLDSSLVLHHMANHSSDITAFSVGFAENPYAKNEAEEAALTAKHFGASYHKVTLTTEEVVSDFENFITALDQPSVDGLNTYVVSKYAASEMTVALSGLGGDELFAGYTRQVLMQHRLKSNRGVQNFLSNLIPSGPLWGTGIGDLLMKTKARLSADNFSWVYGTSRTSIYPSELKKWVKPPAYAHKRFLDYWNNLTKDTPRSLEKSLMKLEFNGFMIPQLLRDMDPVSMWHSLEVRFPLIDHHLVEMAYQLPMDYKIASGSTLVKSESDASYQKSGTKYLLQQIYEPHLPNGFLSRTKNGFKLPLLKFWEQGLSTYYHDLENEFRMFFGVNDMSQQDFGLTWRLFIFLAWYQKIQRLSQISRP